ncbi:hypothetical protein MXS87_11445 [Escherichia coli]|nr:hypothetical protein [Escherichia coli]
MNTFAMWVNKRIKTQCYAEVKYNSGIVIIDEIYWKLLRHSDAARTKAGIFAPSLTSLTTIDQIT